jgi:transposase-like protein
MVWLIGKDCFGWMPNNGMNWRTGRNRKRCRRVKVFRARLILALADGMSYREIERRLGASAPTVSKWKSRFQQQGIEGLLGRHQGRKPPGDAGSASASHPTRTAETIRGQHALL